MFFIVSVTTATATYNASTVESNSFLGVTCDASEGFKFSSRCCCCTQMGNKGLGQGSRTRVSDKGLGQESGSRV